MKNLLTTFYLLLTTILFAQPSSGGRISGKILDSKTAMPLAYSSVTIQSLKDSTLLLGSLVDEKGFFEINKIPFGAYVLTVSFVGYTDFVQKPVLVIPPDKMDINLGTIKVVEDSKILQEVEITAEKNFMQVNAEKKVFNMDKNVLASGGSAIDALKQVPVVEVDQDGNLSMRGSGNLRVFINGKPSGITTNNTKAILDAIPSSQIESIEIINNPSAKYDAEGDVGIINIVLKKNTKAGLNGNFTIGYGTKYDANTGVTLSYRKNNFSVTTSYNFRFRESYNKGTSQRYNFFPNQDPYYLNTNDYGKSNNFSNTINNNIDYDFKEKNSISLSTLFSQDYETNKGRNQTYFLDSFVDYLYAYNRYDNSKETNWQLELNPSYRRTFKDKTNDLVIAGNYAYTNNLTKPIYTQKTLDVNNIELPKIDLLQRNTNKDISHSGFVQSDYTQPFQKIKSKLEIGYKFSLRDITSELYADSLQSASQQYIYDSSISNKYNYNEIINGAYIIFSGAVKKIMNYKAGVRVENTNIAIQQNVGNQSFKQKYFDYFPSASMSFNLPKNHSLSIAYSKRINRPNSYQLNPFGNYSDPYNILTGNPNMKPAYTHALEITYIKSIQLKPSKKDSLFQRNLFFSATVYTRFAYNVFTRFRTVDSFGRSIVNFDNLSKGQNIGLEFTSRIALFKWWNFLLSANLYQNKIKGNVPNGEVDATTNSFQYNLRLMNNFQIGKQTSIQLMVFYRSKIKFLQGEITPMVFANIGVRYDFMKNNKASIAINVSDIFHTQYFGASTFGNSFSGNVKRYWESTVGNIVFTYRFGKSEGKSSQQNKKKSNFEDNGAGVDGGG